MFIGILFSVIVSASVSMFSFLTFAVRPRELTSGQRAFVIFWFLMGFVWLATAVADFLSYADRRDLSLKATYVLQIFVGASLIAAAYFLATYVLNAWRRKEIAWAYGIAYCFFLITLFTFEVRPRGESFFSTQNISPDTTLFIFIGMFIPLWVGSLILLVRAIRDQKISIEGGRTFYIFSALSLLILGIAGAPDEIGFVAGWAVTASRLASMVAAITAYAATLSLHDSKELIV
ncbi:MAG: hypothetical protein AAB372_01240 [Patescibacteria group bacterium]